MRPNMSFSEDFEIKIIDLNIGKKAAERNKRDGKKQFERRHARLQKTKNVHSYSDSFDQDLHQKNDDKLAADTLPSEPSNFEHAASSPVEPLVHRPTSPSQPGKANGRHSSGAKRCRRIYRQNRKLHDSVDGGGGGSDASFNEEVDEPDKKTVNSPDQSSVELNKPWQGVTSLPNFRKEDSQQSLRLSTLGPIRGGSLESESVKSDDSLPRPHLHRILDKSLSSDRILQTRNSRHRLFQRPPPSSRVYIPELSEDRRESLLSNVLVTKERRRESSLSDLCNELVSHFFFVLLFFVLPFLSVTFSLYYFFFVLLHFLCITFSLCYFSLYFFLLCITFSLYYFFFVFLFLLIFSLYYFFFVLVFLCITVYLYYFFLFV